MAWLGGLGTLKKDMSSSSLLKLVALIFVISGSICATYIIYDLYSRYSSGTPEEQEILKGNFTGKNLFTNGGKLLIRVSALILIFPPFRKSKIICGVVGTCYVLLPFYNDIISKLVN